MQRIVALDEIEWGQIIDGLTCRAEQYELTAQYHQTGYAEDYILEVRDAAEARAIAEFYRSIISKVEVQLGRAASPRPPLSG